MAGVRRVTYAFVIDGVSYGIRIPQGFYTNIDQVVGLTEATDTNRPKFVLTQREAIKKGAITQLGILYKKGTRLVKATILCATPKVMSAISALEKKQYRGYEIHSAFQTMNRRLG